nr:retrovirus-related Pol polyprotein from transposon TNT 1-94 [Tanacetum cinerariifolium]
PEEQANSSTGIEYGSRHTNADGQNAGNPAGYNDVIGNQVIHNAVQNPPVQNVRNQNGLIGVQGNGNQNQIGNGNLVAARAEGNAAGQNGNQIRCYNYRGVGHYARNCTVRPRRRDAAYLLTQLLIAQKEEARIQLQAEEYDLMVVVADLDEIEESWLWHQRLSHLNFNTINDLTINDLVEGPPKFKYHKEHLCPS